MNIVKIIKTLTPVQKARARARARMAGRDYPNYIDNLWVYRVTLSKIGTKSK